MTDILKKLTRQEIRRLKPGDWVAWSKTSCHTPTPASFWNGFWEEGQLMDYPVRCHQDIRVRLNGLPHRVPKNRLYKVQPIVTIENQHDQYDYNA
jgi:hypothetical protein